MFQTSLGFLFAILMGAIIGLERASHQSVREETVAGGIRTYALMSLLGALTGFFYVQGVTTMLVILASFVCVMIVVYYGLGSFMTKRLGMTNEISILLTFVLGFLSMSHLVSMQILVILLVAVLLILSLKNHTSRLMAGISRDEIEAFISYALIALVVLPMLPNTPISISDIPFLHTLLSGYQLDLGQFAHVEIFNPRKIWFIVALVTGIDVFGYMLGKILGNKKSFTLTSFVGGFISSTSTTQSLAQKSNRSHMVNSLVGAALIANMASFLQVFLLVGPLNPTWLVAITPTLVAIIFMAGILAVFFLSKHDVAGKEKKTSDKKTETKKIFSLLPAIKFACLLIAVKFLTKICLILFGNSGFIISSIIASFAGIDAIVINLADMAGKIITFKTALLTFILVNATNLLSKFVYSFIQGTRSFAIRFGLSVGCIITISFLTLLFT